MSITLYPARLVMVNAIKSWENVVPMEGDYERIKKDATGNEDNPYEANPDYLPFSTIDMSSGNLIALLRMIRVNADWCDSSGHMPILEAFKAAHQYLFVRGWTREMEAYTAERVFAIREMARLGMSRGATHIVWA